MLGCSYDSLVQREKARRMKRISAMIALCLLLAASFIGMLFAKNQELTRKNQQLTEAIELSLRREADLLVKKAEDALQSGDIAAAMQFAGNALYSADIQRPYSPQAERLLFSTLDVLGEEADLPLLSRVALTHRAPVEMMACTTDGSIVYTIDAYGTVSSFDSADGKLHWSCKLKEKESGSRSPLAPQLWYDEENQRIGCYYADSLWGLNAATGQILWQTRLENTADAGFFFEAESRQLACIERE